MPDGARSPGRRGRRRPAAALGLVLVGAFLGLALAAPLVAPFDPTAQPAKRLLPPSARHLLGTDDFGRDVFSRVVYGARVSLQVGLVSVGLALALGGTLGLVSGYCLGVVDALAGRVIDVMFAFPSVILIIAISGVLGAGLGTAMLAIGIVYAPIFARVVRAPTLAVVQQPYVEGARAVGAGVVRVLARHVLPNIAAPVIVQTTLSFSTAILSEATLSFLGLGTQPPSPSWGTMLSAGRRFMELAPWVAVYPGLAIALTVLGLNLVGDALRDALDPRLRQAGV
ncbi:MAG TPA: ABC transporter permease [Methylomirabilota bacterium]|jgi:peptide/nickel transport system permease protein|nr:ABC transporter permease [Methylomirabilota bacterium]